MIQYSCSVISLDFLRILWHLLLPEVSANDATEATKQYGKNTGPDE